MEAYNPDLSNVDISAPKTKYWQTISSVQFGIKEPNDLCWQTNGLCVAQRSRLMEEQIQVRLRRERLDRILNELIAINVRDKAFLCVQEPEPAEVADWRIRRSRVAQILEEFQTLVGRASWEA